MRINARLDEARSRKLDFLKRATISGVSDIVKQAIDLYYDQVKSKHPNAREILASVGFIGSSEGRGDLSETYKKDLTEILDNKHDHR